MKNVNYFTKIKAGLKNVKFGAQKTIAAILILLNTQLE